MARPIVLIPHLFRLANVIKFLKRTIHPPSSRHLDPFTELTRLDTIDLGSKVPGHAQQGILGGVDVAGSSEPQILAPSSTPRFVASTSEPWISALSSKPWILAPSMDSKPTAKFPLSRLLSFLHPPSRVLSLPNPFSLLNQRI